MKPLHQTPLNWSFKLSQNNIVLTILLITNPKIISFQFFLNPTSSSSLFSLYLEPSTSATITPPTPPLQALNTTNTTSTADHWRAPSQWWAPINTTTTTTTKFLSQTISSRTIFYEKQFLGFEADKYSIYTDFCMFDRLFGYELIDLTHVLFCFTF